MNHKVSFPILLGGVLFFAGWILWHRWLISQEEWNQERCKANIVIIRDELRRYRQQQGRYPKELRELSTVGLDPTRLVCPSASERTLACSYAYLPNAQPNRIENLMVPHRVGTQSVILYCSEHSSSRFSFDKKILALTEKGDIIAIQEADLLER